MRYAGLSIEEKSIKLAIFSKEKNQLKLEKLEEFSEIPHDLLKEKNLRIVSGLSSDDIVRRDVKIPLKNEKAIFKALPFQLEGVLPFTTEETLVYPFLYKEGDVTVFATTRQALKNHLDKIQIDPDQVSCTTLALARFARFLFPEQPLITLIYQNSALALEGEKVIFSQSFDDTDRLQLVLKNKFSQAFTVPTDTGPSFQEYPYEILWKFAIPIGLALEGIHEKGCQFRQNSNVSLRETQKKRRRLFESIGASLGLAALLGIVGGLILQGKKQGLQKRIQTYFSTSNLSLEESISSWQKTILKESKEFPLLPDVPTVHELLSWIGQTSERVDIIQLSYNLTQYPKANGKEDPYVAEVHLEYKAENPEIARRFQEALEKNPTWIDKKQKIVWSQETNCYKLSFKLRKI